MTPLPPRRREARRGVELADHDIGPALAAAFDPDRVLVEAFAEHNLVAARAETTCPAAAAQFALTTAGIFQVPSMMDGGFSRGQYIRSIRTNLSFGAGSQFASLALPGDWF